MNNSKNYNIQVEENKLIFSTTSFKAEKTSLLHKGIYNKEFSSMMLASAACIMAYTAMSYMNIVFIRQGGLIQLFVIVCIFILVFVIARRYLFCDKHLKIVFNKESNTAGIYRHGPVKKSFEEIPLDSIESIVIGSRKFTPQNIDGIRFVEKISLQHGNFVPGLSDEEEFITLSLRLTDGSERIIYAGNTGEEHPIPIQELEHFLGKKAEIAKSNA